MIDNSIFNNKKVVYHTLGCKLNFAETSAIGKQLSEEGFVKARPAEQADLCIVNTCSVTDVADSKCRQAIKKLRRQYPKAIMVVTGCYAQLKPQEIAAIEGVDLVLGSNEKFDMLKFLRDLEVGENKQIHRADISQIKQFRPSCSQDDRTRYFLKVQDGCSYRCSYCTIPFARGRSRSGTLTETVEAARKALAAGAKEIVLTGVNIGDFGRGTKESFFDLVQALDQLPEEDIRFRISSIEPNLLTDDIIRYVARSRHFMPHFHIPLQSGTNEALKIMKRHYTRELFADKITCIKHELPHAFIGVDVIVGIRGETDELFQQSCDFIQSLDISQLHVFTYSERSGTKMLEIEHQVPIPERKRRSEILHRLSDQKTNSFYEKQMGQTTQVLWESRRQEDKMTGFSSNYIRVERPYDRKRINQLETIRLGNWNDEKSALRVEETGGRA